MNGEALLALSPLDGRYAGGAAPLAGICSEFGLIQKRVLVEISWFRYLANADEVPELPALSVEDNSFLDTTLGAFDLEDAKRIKKLEDITRHDVKAIEYWLKELLATRPTLAAHQEFVHFACTSEDINNLAYGLMLRQARAEVLLPAMVCVTEKIADLAEDLATAAMPGRTHGQLASPTTMGKELANHVFRLRRQLRRFAAVPLSAKMNGAVGNYSAHLCAYPELDWPVFCARFVRGLGLAFNPYSTQIEPHDCVVEYCQALRSCNRILVDFNRDLWGYISLGYFVQEARAGETGSSTMPHKINPIDFENAEGNLGVANAILDHLAHALPVSRWQRDLSDSTAQRNLGVGLAHSLLAWSATQRGLGKLRAAPEVMAGDLDGAWELLAEPVQTLMRKHGLARPYERLKALTKGRSLAAADLHLVLDELQLPAALDSLRELTPAGYTGLAVRLALAIKAADADGFTVEQVAWQTYSEILRDIRQEVFIHEQAVPRQIEWDGNDENARHFLASWGDLRLGTARLLADGQIGRMAVRAPWRGCGIGRLLLQAAVTASLELGVRPFLNAQTRAVGFYEQAGFVSCGEIFMEAGIPHVRMTISA